MNIKARMLKALSVANEAEFAQIIEGIHPADIAEVLESFNAEERSEFFEKIDLNVSQCISYNFHNFR